jgi:hypothetical protein
VIWPIMNAMFLRALLSAICCAFLGTTLMHAGEIVGSVVGPYGQPISGATVRVLGVGTDTTTSSGEFRIATPTSMIGRRVTVQVFKDGWALNSSQPIVIVVPASPTEDPVRIYMAKAGASLGAAAGDGVSVEFSFLPPDEETPAPEQNSQDAISRREEELFSVSYLADKDDHGIHVKPRVPYLGQLDSGGPVLPHSYHWTPFEIKLPELDIKIVNNTRKTIFLTEADFLVERSDLDTSPVLIIPREGYHMATSIENFGWGRLKNPKLTFDLIPFKFTSEDADDRREEMEEVLENKKLTDSLFNNTLKRTVAIDEDEDGRIEIDLTPALTVLGVDVTTVRNAGYKLNEDEYSEPLKKACGPFVGCSAIFAGEIAYDDPAILGKRRSVKLVNVIHFGPPGKGQPRPPSFRYSVRLEADGKNYVKKVSLSQTLAPQEADRFTIKIAADRSSQHHFRVKLICNDGKVLQSPPVSLNLFMPRGADRYLKDETRKSKP